MLSCQKSKNNLRIGFYPASEGGLTWRGTEIALYDYAHFNETILHNKSIIILNSKVISDSAVLKKFINRFEEIMYIDLTKPDLDQQLESLKLDAIYLLRFGRKSDQPQFLKIPMLIHCVYHMSPTDSHGLVYAGISKSVAEGKGTGLDNQYDYPVVPHMIHVANESSNYRKLLAIPENAIVFGRLGGADTWDLNIAKQAIIEVLKFHTNIWFLFAVRPSILNDVVHPRLICLQPIIDLTIKRKFINTCNALLHAQSLGDSFGLTIGEFSVCNKPIIVWNGGRCQEHLILLGEKAIKYRNMDDLYQILTTFNPSTLDINWNVYQDYTPEKVMEIFDRIFLQLL